MLDEEIVLATVLRPTRSGRTPKMHVNFSELIQTRKRSRTFSKQDKQKCDQFAEEISSNGNTSETHEESSSVIEALTRADNLQRNKFTANDHCESITNLSGRNVPILPENSREQDIMCIVKQLPEISKISVTGRTEILDVPLSITTTLSPNNFDSNVGSEESVLDRSLNNINKLFHRSKQHLNSQNITISHDDNKLTIVTEDNI